MENIMTSKTLDLSPARWIWYPSGRCLQNTFVLFRRELDLSAAPKAATGWIVADSRYRLFVNGQRVQWGPAPADPQHLEADPLDLTSLLHPGKNVIGCEVLFYGHGEGTWPLGKPGFLFRLDIENAIGEKESLLSDSSWQAHIARSWQPGHYTRWYLRALQEEFDARLYPYGWAAPGFSPETDWLPAMEHNCPADMPVLCSTYDDYMMDIIGDRNRCDLSPRSIPLLNEELIPVKCLAESLWIAWDRPPREYFECRTPNAFRVAGSLCADEIEPGKWRVILDGTRGAALTYEFAEQIVGWPYFTIHAPAGTVVELLVHEAHEIGGPALLNTHWESWSRFLCKDGENTFEPFDYESLRWLQLHIHGAVGEVRVERVGVRRRVFPWPNSPQVSCSDSDLQRLLNASINTLHNSAQETLVDGMARERQQYSGDVAHQAHAIYFAFGETRLPARYINTYSRGITHEGYFLDCWPAYDRLCRVMQRQLYLSKWGPILDHGIGFVFDCFHHYMYSGDLSSLEKPFAALVQFVEYLQSIRRSDGLLPVEDIGTPCVWMDHIAYQQTRHKKCAFNLYASAMLENAFAPLCAAFGNPGLARDSQSLARNLLDAAIKHFWRPERGLFCVNLPWRSEEKQDRFCDRSLATSILFDQCPGNNTEAALRMLVECPPEMGFSYPANACWRLWALAKAGRIDVILNDLRERWATLDSVRLNNTLQEDWEVIPDSTASEWSHCPVVPLYLFFMAIAGIKPLAPGFSRCEIRPQLGDLEHVSLVAHTVQGPIRFESEGPQGSRSLRIQVPEHCAAELILPAGEQVDLSPLPSPAPPGHKRYALPWAKETVLHLKIA